MPPFLRALALNQRSTVRYTPKWEIGASIPKIIHQTYPSWDKLPEELKHNIADMCTRNPEWTYRFYDDAAVASFITECYGHRILADYESIDPRYGASRMDLFRYLLIYREGGVYLDIKSSIDRPLDDVLLVDDLLILSQWRQDGRFAGAGIHDWHFARKIEGGEFQQWHLICAAGHPYIDATIQAVIRNIRRYVPGLHAIGRNGGLSVTGPIAYTLACLPLLPLKLHRLVDGETEIGLRYSAFADNAAHHRLFDAHYTQQECPTVRVDSLRRALAALYRLYSFWRDRTKSSVLP